MRRPPSRRLRPGALRLAGAVLLPALLLPAAGRAAEPAPPNAPASADASASTRKVPLAQAVDTALARSPRIEGAERHLDGARAQRRAVRGHFGPIVQVEAYASHWDAPLDVAVPLPEVPGYDLQADPLRVRDQNTQQIRATVIQPLTGLATTWYGYQAAAAGEDAAERGLVAQRRDVVLATVRAYLDALKAEALRSVAAGSVRQIEAHLQRLRRLVEGGLAQRGDVLEAEARLAEVKAALARAESAVDLTRSRLAVEMGLGADQPVVPAPVDLAPPPLPADAQGSPRPELEAARDRARQADQAAVAAWVGLAPQVAALGRYQHTWGSAFAGGEEAFVGATLSWNVFEWGASFYDARRADARAAEARAGVRALADGLSLQRVSARRELRLAEEEVGVAEDAIPAAQENLRLARRRFDAGAATSTDVLDAEALLARAQGRLAAARYDLLAAHAALRHALGLSPLFTAPEAPRAP